MNTIQNLFQQAQLAEAAYVNLTGAIGNQNELKTALNIANPDTGGTFSPAQAAAFVAHWRVVNQYTASGLFGLTDASGFSATVFQNIDTGAYTFAARGTVGATDLINADFSDIVLDGLAMDQIVDMYNYWQSLNTSGIYQAAKLDESLLETARLNALRTLAYDPATTLIGIPLYTAYLDELKASGAILDSTLGGLVIKVRRIVTGDSNILLAGTELATGSGALIVCPKLNVTGHSLGGHLAAAFTRLFPNVASSAVTINGAGFPTGLTPGLGGNALSNIQNLFTALHGASDFSVAAITNVHGDDPNMVSMNSQYGLVF